MPDPRIADFVALLGERGVRTGDDAAPHLQDWRGRYRGQALAVLLPDDAEQAAAVIRHARARGIAVFPQGGNTGLCAGAVPGQGADNVVLSTARLTRIREIDTLADVAVVDSGVTLSTLHAAAEEENRSFPLRLGAEGTAQIGGLISTNAGGTGALRYGVMRDLVLGLEVVLPDGSILRRLGGVRKDNRGYDWKHLFIGGEGSIGFVTGAALKLFPRMRDEAHAACAVPSPEAAVELLRHLRERFDTALHACELVSRGEIDLVLRHIPGMRAPFDPLPEWTLMIALGSVDPQAGLEGQLTGMLSDALECGLMTDAVVPKNVAEVKALWAVRHSLSEANKKEGLGIVFDVAVRISSVPQFIEQATAIVQGMAAEEHLPIAPLYVSHLGDGNVHLIAMIPHAAVAGIADPDMLVDRLQARIHDLASDMGGSFSAEHGIGRKLAPELAARLDPAEMDAMRRIKRAFDPDGAFSPGILLAPDARDMP